ncbi:MAG: hypothetical protein IJ760_00915, partial [Bacteroidales bacterium]|nr:hypothetical protein [Bacteroidales bacterium]
EAARPAALAALRFAPSAGTLVAAQAERLERWRLRLGMEQAVAGSLWLRAGLATNPLVATFGAGARMGAVQADVAASVHSALGISPQLSITLCF